MEPIDPTDADLVAETLAGSREPFGKLYDRHARIVRAVVAGVSGDWSAVDDMVQECFLRAYRNLVNLRDPHCFGQWIVGIARQVARERRRTLRRDRHEFRDLQVSEIGPVAGAEPELDGRDEIERVMQKLVGLPERERVAVHAYFLQEQDPRQAADLLGLSRSGFYAVVQRAVARLARELRPCETKKGTGHK